MSARATSERALAAALGLYLAAAGGLAAFSLAREARATSFGSLESLDERAARALHDVELYRALRDRTPRDAPVFFAGDADEEAAHLAFSQTEPLVFPRRFFRVEAIPEGWSPAGIDPRTVVVAYGRRRAVDLSAWFEPVAEGARFRLWRLAAAEEER